MLIASQPQLMSMFLQSGILSRKYRPQLEILPVVLPTRAGSYWSAVLVLITLIELDMKLTICSRPLHHLMRVYTNKCSALRR